MHPHREADCARLDAYRRSKDTPAELRRERESLVRELSLLRRRLHELDALLTPLPLPSPCPAPVCHPT